MGATGFRRIEATKTFQMSFEKLKTLLKRNFSFLLQFEAPQDVSGSANVILYVGLIMMTFGLFVTFIGLGDNGFKTRDLKLIGPSLVGCGVFFAMLRILFCTVPESLRRFFTCCVKPEDTKKLIDEDSKEDEEEDTLAASLSSHAKRNGLLKPMTLHLNKTSPMKVEVTNGYRQKTIETFNASQSKADEKLSLDQVTRPKRISYRLNGIEETAPAPKNFSSAFSLKDLDLDVSPDLLPRSSLVDKNTSQTSTGLEFI